jgi:amidase
VKLDRIAADTLPRRNGRVRQAVSHRVNHAPLAWGEHVVVRGATGRPLAATRWAVHGEMVTLPSMVFPPPLPRWAIPYRQLVLLCATVAAPALVVAQARDADIVQLDAVALRDELAAGRISALEATRAFLRRIEALDDSGPTLGAIVETNPDAEAIARSLDEQRTRQAGLGPLHGVPVLLKANIETADAMATTAGSLALAMHRADRDAEVAARLRAAGAVLLGKTNLSEWANFRSTASTSGWSSVGGQTRNPYALDRNPCGSSSGSAVAVAARLAPLAVGTETDGSIVCPAGANGVVGLKPTHGLISTRGIVPLAPSQDTAGPLARTAGDAALLLDVLADTNVRTLGEPSIAGRRLGVLRDSRAGGSVDEAFERALLRLRAAGAVLVDPVALNLPPETGPAELFVLQAEFGHYVGEYLAQVARGPHTLDALIEYNELHGDEVMPYFGQDLLLAARASGGIDTDSYRAAAGQLAEVRLTLAQLFSAQELDALIAPTNSRAWRIDYAAGDAIGFSSSQLAAVTGYPSMSVPAELAAELPLGISLVAKPGQEAGLIAIAVAFEQLRGPFPPPRFLPSAPD